MHGGFYYNLFGNFTDDVEGVKIPFGEQFPDTYISGLSNARNDITEVLLEQLTNAYNDHAKLHITVSGVSALLLITRYSLYTMS